MVLHADGKNSYAVSFPRDLYVNIPGHGKGKINAAFNEGPQEVIDTLKADFDVDIQHYLEVNFKTFEDIVNAVGSVPVYFPYPARDQLSGLGPTPAAGCYHLDGAPALAYVRSRHLEYFIDGKWRDASPQADIDRIARQQDFIKKLGRIAVAQDRQRPDDRARPRRQDDPEPHRRHRLRPSRVQPAGAGVPRALGTRRGGPTFETLPWKMGDSVGSFLTVKQPEADAVLAVLRGQAPIPTTTTAPPANGGSGSRRHDGAEREGVGRAGAGAQRLRGAERGREHLAGPRGQGFRARRRRERPPRHHRPRPRSGTPRPTSPRPSCSPPTCPTPSWCRTPRSPAPTSCWPWARVSAGSAAAPRPPRARRRPLRPHCRPKLPVSSRGAPTRCPPHHQHPRRRGGTASWAVS